jgi:hypothetical protein
VARLTVVALLHKHPDRGDEFELFEAAALDIMRRFDGRLERRIALDAGGDPARPHEVHVLTFPDAAAFDRYRTDPALLALAKLRSSAIRDTTVWFGADAPPPSADPSRPVSRR